MTETDDTMNPLGGTRALGSTRLLVSPMGLGLAALGRPGYINLGRADDLGLERTVAAMERRCHDVLDAAYAAGVRYVDAARSYGRAEQFLASWLQTHNIPLDAIMVGSKWGYTYTGEWRLDAPVHEVKDLSLATLDRQVAESRHTLGAFLHVYQIHSATLESGVLEDQRVLTRLRDLRSDGLAIGLTVSGPRQADTIRRALEVAVDGVPLFQVVQATWNLLETSAGPALAEASALGCGVIVKEALANGRLTGHGTEAESLPLRRQAEALRTPIEVLALAAALSQPWADVVLSGAVTTTQLHSNLQTSATNIPTEGLPDIALTPVEYWSRRGALAWG